MIDLIVIVFSKTTCNTKLALNLVTIEFLDSFCAEMLAFLFAIIHYGISEYQSRNKIVRLIDVKIAQSVYYHT